MSLKSYDTSLKRYLSDIFPNVILSSVDDALDYGTDDNLNIKLPMITFDRISNELDESQYNFPSTKRGRWSREEGFDRSLIINPVYQVNIWSNDRYECDDICREILGYIMIHSELKVEYINSDEVQYYPLIVTGLDMDIDTSSFIDVGRLYRQIITLEIRGATLLYSKEVSLVKSIPIRTYTVHSKDNKLEITTQEDDNITPDGSIFNDNK